MPGSIIELYVPCRVIEVTVSIAPTEHLSKLETLVLRALYAGINQFRDLVDMFGLGQRPTLDLVSDLWHRGYISLDMEKSELGLAEHVSEAITHGLLQRLSSGEVQERKMRVAQELLSGHVLRIPRRPMQVQQVRVVPVEYSGRPLGSEHRQEVIGVLDEVLTSASASAVRPGARVLGVNFGLLSLTEQTPMPLHDRTLMELRVECTRHSGSGQLTFEILHPAALPVRVRKSMERELNKLTVHLPAHSFVKTMRAHAEMPSIVERLDPMAAAVRILELCAQLSDSNGLLGTDRPLFEMVQSKHEELELAALPARDGAEELLLSQSRIEMLTNRAQHAQVIEQAVRSAEKQLILCLPSLRYEALQNFLPWLEDRLNRGVRVFLLWGREPESLLHTNVNNRLAALQQEHPQLRVSLSPARVGSTVIIQDDQLAVLACSDPFAQIPSDSLLLGAALRPNSAQANGVIADLIDWCRNTFPDYKVSNLMETSWDSEKPSSTNKTALLGPPHLPPSEDPSWHSDRAPVTFTLWCEQWRIYAQEIEQCLALRASTARMVTDSRIREVFWSLVRRKQQRLLLISERLTSAVVNSKLIQALRERLTEGARVCVMYTKVEDQGVMDRLQELADRWPEHMQLHQARPGGMRSECVLSDDRILLTSLPILGIGGDYAGSSRWRTPTHGGVLLTGSEAVQAILDSLCLHDPQLATALAINAAVPAGITQHALPPAPKRGQTPPPALGLLSRITTAASNPVAQAEILRQWFCDMPTPLVLASLAQLQRASLPEIWLAVGCALGTRSSLLTTPEGQEWQARLAAHHWHDQDCPHQAWLLLHDWPEQATNETLSQLPRLPVVALAAVQNQRNSFSVRLSRLPSDLLSEESCAVAVLSVVAVLRNAHLESAQWLHAWKDRIPPPLSLLADSVLRYYSQTGSSYPFAEMTRQFQSVQTLQQRERVKKELITAMNDGRQIKTAFTLMRATWEGLYTPSGPLAQLERIMSTADGSVHRWCKEHATIDRDLEGWFDKQTEQAAIHIGWFGPPRIERGPRTSSLHRLRQIFQMAKQLAELDASLGAAPRRRDPNITMLTQEIGRLRDPLRAAVAAAKTKRTPSAPLLRNLVELLRGPMEAVK